MTQEIRVPAYRRSTFQVALLMFATFGLYVFVWAFYIRRACAALLEQEDQPLWKSIALIVPLFNLFLMFDLGKKIQGVGWRADPKHEDASLPWLGVSVFFFNVAARLKADFAYVGLLGFVPIALMHQQFSRAQVALIGEAGTPTRLHWLEWIVIVLGGGFWSFVTFGYAKSVVAVGIAEPHERAWFFSCFGVAIVLLVLFAFFSRRAIAAGLAMHADPSTDRIAPYSAT